MILFLFFAHLGIGIIIMLAWVSREAGVKFFRFTAGLAAILIGVAFLFRPPETAPTEPGRVALAALAIAEASTVVYWATVGRIGQRPARESTPPEPAAQPAPARESA